MSDAAVVKNIDACRATGFKEEVVPSLKSLYKPKSSYRSETLTT